MRRGIYPPWYGLPRGVELRLNGTAAIPARAGGFRIAVPCGVQVFGLLLGLFAGVGFLGFYVFMRVPTDASAGAWEWMLSSEAGTAFLQSGFWPYSGITGLFLAAAGIYVAWTTRFLTALEESGPIARLLATAYVSPGILLFYAAVAAVLVLAIFVVLMGIAFILAAIIGAAMGSDS